MAAKKSKTKSTITDEEWNAAFCYLRDLVRITFEELQWLQAKILEREGTEPKEYRYPMELVHRNIKILTREVFPLTPPPRGRGRPPSQIRSQLLDQLYTTLVATGSKRGVQKQLAIRIVEEAGVSPSGRRSAIKRHEKLISEAKKKVKKANSDNSNKKPLLSDNRNRRMRHPSHDAALDMGDKHEGFTGSRGR